MDDRASIGTRLDPRRRDEWVGINFLLGEMEQLHARGLVLDEAYGMILGEYSARRDGIEHQGRLAEALHKAREVALINPKQAFEWSARAREIGPDRPEGWIVGIELLRKMGRHDEAAWLASDFDKRFPDLAGPVAKPEREPARGFAAARVAAFVEQQPSRAGEPLPSLRPPVPRVSWSSVAGEFLQEHWQMLISALAVLLIVVSSTVGASLVLGPLLWSPVGKVVLALVFTAVCAGFGLGLARWGAERAGRVMLATSLFVIPINLMLLGELRLLTSPSLTESGLGALDVALLLVLARSVVGALGIGSAGWFTAAFFGMAAFNAGASPGMPFEPGFAVFLAPGVIFLGAVAWLNRRVGLKGEGDRAGLAYLEFGLLAFAFLTGVLRTGAAVLHLLPNLYAVPVMLASLAGVSTARAIAPVEKDRRLILLFQQGGLSLSAFAFALALARPPGPSALFSGNTLAVASLGLALYVTSLRATRLPAYLYCGFAALVVAYFGAFYFASDLVRSVEEAARRAMGYDRKLPLPFKAINGLVFNVGLIGLSRFFARRWSDDRLARHCHYIGLPLSVAACVLSGFEPKAALICLGGYAVLYSAASWMFAEPRLVYLACATSAGAAFFGASLAGEATLELRSMLASVLGLAFWAIRETPWLRRGGEPYQTPLIRAGRVMAAFAMAAATLGAVRLGTIAPEATLAFLLTATLALLNGRGSPRVSVYLLAVAALLGAWLGGYHLLVLGGRPTSAAANGLAVACFACALLLVGEGARRWFERSESAGAYLRAIGWAVPVVVLFAWGLAGWGMVVSVTVARGFLVGSSALLWLTRFRREPVLVYLGLSGLAVWAGCLCGLVVPGGEAGRLLAWLAMTSAGCSVAYWAVGEWTRRREETFYSEPFFLMASALAIGAGVLAWDGRWFSVESYRPGVAAMLIGSSSLGLVAWSRRWPASVVLAAGEAVGASYLAILSQGPSSPDHAWVLAFVAALESIACRGAALAIRKFSKEPDSPMARPLDFCGLGLLVVAVALGSQSPAALVAIAAASLLMIGAFPSANWLYGTALAVGAAVYHGWLSGASGLGVIPFVMVGAYASWTLGVALLRYGPRLLERLGLPSLNLHAPMARVTVGLGVLAVILRLDAIAKVGAWSSLAWLPWALALLCLLMLRFDPIRGWVHASVGLTGLGFAASLAPWVEPRGGWFSGSMALALAWSLAGRGARRVEETCRRRLGIAEGSDAGVFDDWSFVAFGLTGLALAGVVFRVIFLGISDPPAVWPDVLVGLGLAGLYVGLPGGRLGRDALPIGLESAGVLALWWLASPGSPFLSWSGIDPNPYLPLATAGAALVVVLLGRSLVARPTEPASSDRRRLVEFTSWAGFGLGLASVFFSGWASGRVALVTLLLTTTALGLLALGWKRVEAAIEGGLTWALGWAVGFVLVVRWTGWVAEADLGSVAALGGIVALFSLWWAAGRFRAFEEGKGGELVAGRRVAWAMEWVAIGLTAPTGLLALADGRGAASPGSVVLIALAVFFAMVAWRRVIEWPVYLAQGLMLACYFRARSALGGSSGLDVVILAMLAYLDLGVSELMGRLRWSHFARPTLRFAMVLPLVPVLQGVWQERLDGVSLFVLLATAGFYALAAWRLRSKIPAYAAAVFFNGALWLGWWLMGWRLAESPQFYLIPVGFSTILFAEVNRQELGRGLVNGARNLGLVLIYASLAAPIWQAQSFGAWLALLLLSLLGIFAGIGLKIQSFLWLGLACFVLDLIYQLGRLGVDHVLARWAVMLSLGVALILFVALNEKKQLVARLRGYYDEARGWE